MPVETRWNTPATEPRTLQLGEHTLTYLPDGAVQLHPRGWLPDTTSADWEGEHRALLDRDGFLAASIGSLLVEHQGHALLIDSGFGPQHVPVEQTHPVLGTLSGGALPRSFERAGRDPGAVESVAFTHLHDDHFGWSLRSHPQSGNPLPNAVLLADHEEWKGWHAPVPHGARTRGIVDGQEVFPGVTAWATPGHTAGHTSYVISSGGRRMVAFGDVFHTPAQLARPDWRVSMDTYPEEAISTRHTVLGELLREDTLAFGNHFADVVFGRVTLQGASPRWEPVDE